MARKTGVGDQTGSLGRVGDKMAFSLDENGTKIETLFDGLQPIPKNSGLQMDGYFVWGGSVIEADGLFHMFASRWPAESSFPSGYMTQSEIVHAVSDNPIGPYSFQDVVTPTRGEAYWDGQMTHNPSIYRVGDGFVLFHNACAVNSRVRKVGYVTGPTVNGPWTRLDEPIPLSDDANNPGACFAQDGSLKLVFRDRELKMGIAEASGVDGPYRVRDFDIMPNVKLEDAYFYFQDGRHHIVCEDNRAQVSGHERWGAHLVSDDGVTDWQKGTPVVAYTHTVVWDDGTRTTFERRERPQLIFDDQGCVTHLCTGVLFEGRTWCLVQPVLGG